MMEITRIVWEEKGRAFAKSLFIVGFIIALSGAVNKGDYTSLQRLCGSRNPSD